MYLPGFQRLRSIKTPNIVKALVKFFTLIGLLRSVQSDQGSAYHPQSQGALERFHQMLKNLLRAYCLQEKKEWDEGLLLLLFAVRESVQESLGFSLFKLVFGHTPRGPLKPLKEVWLAEEVSDGVLTRVSDVCDRLRRANDLALQKLKESQGKMKTCMTGRQRLKLFIQVTKCWCCFHFMVVPSKPDIVDRTQWKRRPVSMTMSSVLQTDEKRSGFAT